MLQRTTQTFTKRPFPGSNKLTYRTVLVSRNVPPREKARYAVFVSAQTTDVKKTKGLLSKATLGGLLLAGATLGPLLDGIHGTVELLEYKVTSDLKTVEEISHAVVTTVPEVYSYRLT